MRRSTVLSLALTALSAAAVAQSAYPAGQDAPPAPTHYALNQTPAPIERGQYAPQRRGNPDFATLPHGQVLAPSNGGAHAKLAPGVFIRVGQNSSVRAVASDATHTELRVERGRANVDVHNPSPDTLVLVDLPGGQTQLLKDGLYTFNADSNTVRVLRGEANGFPGPANASAKPIKIKEYHQLVFTGARVRSVDVNPLQARIDLLPGNYPVYSEPGYGGGYAESGFGGYPPAFGFGPYGDGFGYGYGYPYGFGYGYPYGFGYPYGIGLGFGFGFRGYGYGGYGFRGGFHGRR